MAKAKSQPEGTVAVVIHTATGMVYQQHPEGDPETIEDYQSIEYIPIGIDTGPVIDADGWQSPRTIVGVITTEADLGYLTRVESDSIPAAQEYPFQRTPRFIALEAIEREEERRKNRFDPLERRVYSLGEATEDIYTTLFAFWDWQRGVITQAEAEAVIEGPGGTREALDLAFGTSAQVAKNIRVAADAMVAEVKSFAPKADGKYRNYAAKIRREIAPANGSRTIDWPN